MSIPKGPAGTQDLKNEAGKILLTVNFKLIKNQFAEQQITLKHLDFWHSLTQFLYFPLNPEWMMRYFLLQKRIYKNRNKTWYLTWTVFNYLYEKRIHMRQIELVSPCILIEVLHE